MNDCCIAWKNPDGTVGYGVCPAGNRLPGETEEAWLARVFARDVPPNAPGAVRIAAPVNPVSGEPLAPGQVKLFRGAWRESGGRIRVDMPAAREIKLGLIREERNRRLTASDREKARVDDLGTAAQKTALADNRQALRELPAVVQPALEAIATPAELDAFEPDWPVI